jgi:DHA2 family multidrug resistance protein
MNLSRQLGGSIGIALVSTLLTTRTQQNYLDLATHVSLLNPNTQAAYYGAVNAFHQKAGVGLGDAAQAALKSLFGRIEAQAFMMSFLQLTWIVMAVVLLAFVPLYLLKLRFEVRKAVDAH